MGNENKKINYVMISPNFPPTYYKFSLSLKNLGVNVLGIGDAYNYELSDNLNNSLTEYKQCYSLFDIHSLINIVQYYKDKYGYIDWIESNNEYWLENDSTLREWFNVKTGIFHSDIKKYKAKSEMKKYFQIAGVKCAKYHLSDNFLSTKEFAQEVGYPIFVKPNIGVGSCGTRKINNNKELEDFYLNKDNNEYIFEQFIDGDIYSFDGITNSKGEIIFKTSHKFLVVTDEIVHMDEDDAYFTYKVIPTQINKIGVKIIKSFEIKSRCFHIELFKLKKDIKDLGKKGEFVALEVNMRPPGGYTPDLISISQSVSYYDVFADMIVFDKNLEKNNKEKFYAISVSKKDHFIYKHTDEQIFEKYKDYIENYGRYPKSISDAMGDTFFMAKFKNLNDALKFQKFVREKENEI